MKTATMFLLPTLLLFACDPQESPSYQGEPLVQLRGSVVVGDDAPDEAQAAILWYTSDLAECQGPERSCAYSSSSSEGGQENFECMEACRDDSVTCSQESLDAWVSCAEACGSIAASAEATGFEGCATGGFGERIDLSVDAFPGAFELSLYDAPSDETLLRGYDHGPRVALGVLVALSPDAPDVLDLLEDESAWQLILGGVTTHALIYAADPIPADSAWGQYLGGAYGTGYHLVRYDADISCEFGLCAIEAESRSPETQGFDVELELRFAPVEELFLPF